MKSGGGGVIVIAIIIIINSEFLIQSLHYKCLALQFRSKFYRVVLKIFLKVVFCMTNKCYIIKFCAIKKQQIVKSTLRTARWVHPI